MGKRRNGQKFVYFFAAYAEIFSSHQANICRPAMKNNEYVYLATVGYWNCFEMNVHEFERSISYIIKRE